MTAERDIIIDDVERQDPEEARKAKEEWHKNLVKKLDPEEARKKKEMEDVLERVGVKGMNKEARVKHLAKREAEAEAAKFKEELEKAAERRKKAEIKDKKEAALDRRLERDSTGPFFPKRRGAKKGG